MAAKEMRVETESRLRPAVCRFNMPRLEVDGRHRVVIVSLTFVLEIYAETFG
jgi:hypothetical protein